MSPRWRRITSALAVGLVVGLLVYGAETFLESTRRPPVEPAAHMLILTRDKPGGLFMVYDPLTRKSRIFDASVWKSPENVRAIAVLYEDESVPIGASLVPP